MREGLRSRNRSDELENDIPLSSLVPKKKKRGESSRGGSSSGKKKGVESREKHLIASDTFSDTEVLGSVLKKLKRNGCTSGSVVEKKKGKRKSQVEKRSSSLELVKCSGSKVGQGENESKRSRLDVFDYNEDDLVDYKTFKEELESKHKRVVDDEEKMPSKTVKKKSSPVKRNKGADVSGKVNCEKEDDKSIPSASNSEEKSEVSRKYHTGKGEDGDIVALADKKKVDKSEKNFGHSEAEGNTSTRSAGSSIRKRTRSSVQSKDSIENLQSPKMTERNKSPKGLSAKKNKTHRIRRAEKDASLQQGSECLDPCSSEEDESNKGEPSLTSELCLSTEFPGKMKRKEVKQLIRDQIRSMVESAGWKIDYRPRKSRENYNDAVYIDHSGIVYWSILRAYYGLKKQYENKESSQKHQGTSFSFTPIPKVWLDQLKRRTKKAIALEKMAKHKAMKGNQKTKRKLETKSTAKMHVKKNTSRDKLGSFIRQDGKSLKVRMKKKGRKNGVRRPTSTHNSDKAGNRIKLIQSSKASLASNAHSLQGRKSKTQRGYTLLVRKSDKENSDGGDFKAYTRKRTVLSWLIDSEIVSIGGKVKYMNKKRTRVLLEGTITSDGIYCGCCSEFVTISEFQTHAGRKLYQPCQNIFVESGVSLFQCLIDAWNKQEESKRSRYHRIDIRIDDPNDDACGICGDGGDLICCDGCPSTFHQSCLGIQVLPKGDWHCFNCCCKFCGLVDCTNGQGDETTISNLLTCSQCEEKYHGSCILQKNTVPVDSDVLCGSFCGQECKELFEKLQKLLGIKHELEAGFSWTLIQRSDLESETSFCRYPQKVECNSKLALALSVMNECFLPTIDERSGINLIQNVVYNRGSNFNRLNYSGFYSFLLERGDELISVASIRIRRASFAEMPFIGTRHIYRRQGMCRRLLNAIDSALSSLNLEKLIIPAISELMDTWTRIFGFSPFEESYKHELRSLNLVVFPGVALLQKFLTKHNSVTINDDLGSKATELERNNHLTAEATDSSDTGSVLPDNLSSDVTVVNHTNEIIDEVVVAKTGLQAPSALIQSTSDASNPSDATGELVSHVSKEEAECSNSQSRHEFVSETNSVLLEAEKNSTMPTMNISVEPNFPTIGDVVDEADKKLDSKMDGITSDLQSVAKTPSLLTIDLNESLEFHPPERGSGCYKFQPQDESSAFITETNALLPDVEKETSEKTSVKCNSHDSIEDVVNDGNKVNIIIDSVEKAPHSSVEISAQCTVDGLDECREMHCLKVVAECRIPQSQDECPLIELENKPAKCSHAESSVRYSAVDVVNNVQEVNVIIDGVESNVHASTDISDQCTTDVIDHCSEMHSPKEGSQSWDESTILASRLESLGPVMEYKPTMDSSAEPDLQVSTEDAVDDARDVNIQNNGTEPNIRTLAENSPQCDTEGINARLSTVGGAVCLGRNSRLNSDTGYQNTGGPESKSLEVSLAKDPETHQEEITSNASDEAIKHGNVKTTVAFENGVDAILDHATGTVTEPQLAAFEPNHQGLGENATCLKTLTKCSSKASLEIQDVQSLQQTESDCNASNLLDSFCQVGNKIAVTDSGHKSTGCDSPSSIPRAVSESVCVKCKFIASVKCKGHDFPAKTCNSSLEAVVHHASEPAHQNTHYLADEPLVVFSGCTSNLQDSANGNLIATHEEIPSDHSSRVLPQVFPCDSHDTATVQISNGPGCTSVLLHKAPGCVCDTAGNITLTDELDLDEPNAAASDEISVHGNSEVCQKI